ACCFLSSWIRSVLGPCSGFFFSSRRRHTRFSRDWSSDVCSSDLTLALVQVMPSSLRQIAELSLADRSTEWVRAKWPRLVDFRSSTFPRMLVDPFAESSVTEGPAQTTRSHAGPDFPEPSEYLAGPWPPRTTSPSSQIAFVATDEDVTSASASQASVQSNPFSLVNTAAFRGSWSPIGLRSIHPGAIRPFGVETTLTTNSPTMATDQVLPSSAEVKIFGVDALPSAASSVISAPLATNRSPWDTRSPTWEPGGRCPATVQSTPLWLSSTSSLLTA